MTDMSREAKSLLRKGTISFLCGVPDWQFFPVGEIEGALRASLERVEPRSMFGYSSPHGTKELRSAIAEIIAPARGIKCSPEEVLITAGSQQAFSLLMEYGRQHAPQPVVIFEDPGYTSLQKIASMKGVDVLHLGVDESGAIPEERFIPHGALIFLTPRHQFPTGARLSENRREMFLSLSINRNVVLIEDDYQAPFTLEGIEPAPLYGTCQAASVVYVSTFSKALAPGLRIGYVIANAALIDYLAEIRWCFDRHSPQIIEHTLARLVVGGQYLEYETKVRDVYMKRWQVANDCVSRCFPEYSPQCSGLSLWVPLDVGWDAARNALRKAARRGVIVEDSSRWFARLSDTAYLRLGITAADIPDIEEGITRLARCFGLY